MSSENRPFTPLRARHGMVSRDYATRTKDVEAHLYEPLWVWCASLILSPQSGTQRHVLNSQGRRMCVALRLVANSRSELKTLASRHPDTLLDMVDWLLQFTDWRYYKNDIQRHLEQMLDEGGSAWRVAPDGKSLIERTLEVESTAVKFAAQGDDQIAADINTAWNAAWRREEPSAVEAYAAAVNAIEGVLAPIVAPKHTRPTLGTIISDLRNKPEKWDTRFRSAETVEALTAMLDELWRSQHRHGGAGVPNTLDEARDAVSIAVAVVGLCRRGFLERFDDLTPEEEAADREWAAELRRELDADGAENTIPIEEILANLPAGGE